MSADPTNRSLWIETTPATSYRALSGKPSFDVIVLGGGITGLTTAYLLKREGLRVAVLEMDRVATGVTGYTTAKVTALHGLIYADLIDRHGEDRAEAYAAANLSAVERIADIADEEAIGCDLDRLDAYTYAETDAGADAVRREAEACASLGLKAELVTETPLPFDVIVALRLTDQAAFHPRKYCLGLAKAIHGAKGRIYERTRVLEVEEKKRVCHVKTERGTLSAAHVVVATHLPFMGEGRFYAKTYPLRSYALAIPTKGERLDGMFLNAEEPVRSVRPFTSGRRRGVIVGGENHKVGQEIDTRARYQALEAWASERFGSVAVDHRWSAQDYFGVDGIPYVGRLTRENERVFVATGFRKWGMTNGTAAAMMITDAIVGRENPWATAFDATRIRPKQAAKDFIKEGVDVAAHLYGGKLAPKYRSVNDLAPGAAGLCDLEGETVAAFRDESGRVHAVSPDCTHMGCRLAWNMAELSWDCPCHGSRFDPDGHVLHGPANQDLERKRVPAARRSQRVS